MWKFVFDLIRQHQRQHLHKNIFRAKSRTAITLITLKGDLVLGATAALGMKEFFKTSRFAFGTLEEVQSPYLVNERGRLLFSHIFS